jgi:glycosyltransferase involved in cell wall biosynthesis
MRLRRRFGASRRNRISRSSRLTVLLTTYNHERFVEQALQSVVDQTTTFQFEVVVLEDCSTDNTRAIVQAFAADHRDVVRLALAESNENSNRLFAEQWAACGSEYVAMLDGDDYWTSPDKLQRQVELLDSAPDLAFCFHDVRIVSDGDEASAEAEDRLFVNMNPSAITAETLWSRCFVPGSSPVLRRALIPELPAWWVSGSDAGGAPHGDWALMLLFAQHGGIGYIDEPLGVYRIHGGGVWSSRSPEQQRQDIVNVLQSMLVAFPERESLIRPQLENHQAELEVERRRSLRHAAVVEAGRSSDRVEWIEAILARHVPPRSSVAWLDFAAQPVGLSRELVSVPAAGLDSWELLARGPEGTSSVAWLAPGFAYEFRLVSEGKADSPLASVTVVAELARGNQNGDSAAEASPRKGAFVAANPNPAQLKGTHGLSEISWSTGNASSADLMVASYPLDKGLAEDSAAAIRSVERLRAAGGEFLLVPAASLWWLDAYPELARHLNDHFECLADDSRAGKLYDLGTSLAASG